MTISVIPPKDADAQLFANYLSARPELLTDWALLNLRSPDDTQLLQILVRDYPHSPYMDRARLHLWRHQIAEALRKEEAEPLRGSLGALLEDMYANAMDGSAFDEDRLFLIATTKLDWRDRVGAVAVLRELVDKYPNGAAAQAARQMIAELGDTTPPQLVVTTAPSSIWPPNQKLVPVTVAVTVNDEVDPNPTVKLQSITCDDACNQARDIADATLNTDDRGFQLRATRQGGGTGRTYTITYTATDAAGNQCTARATVNVPHDQGK